MEKPIKPSAMNVEDLIGRSIVKIWVGMQHEHGGMDTASSFLLLDNDVLTGFPWGWLQGDGELWIREVSDRPLMLLPIDGVVRSKVIAQTIMDTISFDSGMFEDKAMLLLENGVVITEVVAAMNGTGHAGLWCFDSIGDLESRYGTNYKRLSDRANIH